jgi:hypothetical protein
MTTFQSPLFGEVSQPSSVQELLDIVVKISSLSSNQVNVFMWRGQADISWAIHSSAYRRLAAQEGIITEQSMINYERALLTQATHRGYRFLNGQELTDIELLARLQHHGAATRLVDATRSVLVALWFAVASHENEVGVLIGVNSYYLGGHESYIDKRSYNNIVEDIKERNYPSTWEPTTVSPRVAAQHSQFLYSRITDSPMGSLCLSDKADGGFIMAINTMLKREARKVLIKMFDIHTKTLFPDLDGFCVANNYQTARGDMYRW